MKRYDFEKAIYSADSGLTSDERTVLVYMAYKKNWETDGLAFPSQPTVSTETGRSLSTVKRAFASLKTKGWLVDTGRVTGAGTKKYQLAIGVTQTPGGVTQTPQGGHPDTTGGSHRPTNKTMNKTSNKSENKSDAPEGGGVPRELVDPLDDELNESITPKVPPTSLGGLGQDRPSGLKKAMLLAGTSLPRVEDFTDMQAYQDAYVTYVWKNKKKYIKSDDGAMRARGRMDEQELRLIAKGKWQSVARKKVMERVEV
jgi:hypothetical protein